mmetsp:Transcript_89055/g.191098  ORF Transcript_89055/g.191098 Transcript_89055/m.191098 type:complete len:294 (-) Transcript_89055:150-1031(-)
MAAVSSSRCRPKARIASASSRVSWACSSATQVRRASHSASRQRAKSWPVTALKASSSSGAAVPLSPSPLAASAFTSATTSAVATLVPSSRSRSRAASLATMARCSWISMRPSRKAPACTSCCLCCSAKLVRSSSSAAARPPDGKPFVTSAKAAFCASRPFSSSATSAMCGGWTKRGASRGMEVARFMAPSPCTASMYFCCGCCGKCLKSTGASCWQWGCGTHGTAKVGERGESGWEGGCECDRDGGNDCEWVGGEPPCCCSQAGLASNGSGPGAGEVGPAGAGAPCCVPGPTA